MYEWPKIGHRNDKSGYSNDPISISMIMLENTGSNPIQIGSVLTQFIPPKDNSMTFEEKIFSDGADFGEPLTMSGRTYAPNYNMFQQGLKLSYSADSKKKLPENWKHDGKELTIIITEPIKLELIEVMLGDLQVDGRRGGAKVSLSIFKKDQNTEIHLLRNQNVPPQGVFSASPKKSQDLLIPGDKIIIKGSNDLLYLMGVRIYKTTELVL